MLKKFHHSRRGFSLMEVSVVLGLIGILLGAIWVTASAVSLNSSVSHTLQEITAVVQNIRNQFAGTQSPPGWTAGTDITLSSIDKLQLFQPEMRRDPTAAFGAAGEHIDHALYNSTSAGLPATGSFQVVQAAASNENRPALCGNVPCFRIILSGLQQSACMKLLEGLPLTDPALGIVQAGVYAASGTTNCTDLPTSCLSSCTGTPCLISSMPLVSTIAGWCGGTAQDNVLFVDYKLHN